MQRYFCQRHLKIALYANACKCLRALFSLLSAWQAHAISRNSNTAALGQILELKGVVIVMTKALASIIYLVCASCYTWLYLAEFPPCQSTRPLLRYSSLSELPTKIKHKNAEPKVWRHAVQSFMLFCLAWQMLHKKAVPCADDDMHIHMLPTSVYRRLQYAFSKTASVGRVTSNFFRQPLRLR